MTGSEAVTLLRRSLRDDTTLNRQGAFWSDEELYRALNNAQLHVVHSALASGTAHWLLRNLTVILPAAGQVSIPLDYLHAFSATVNGKLAQLYEGAEAIAFFTAHHAAAFIVGNTVYFRNGAVAATAATLHYYRKPTGILDTTDLVDLPPAGFDLVLDLAAIILGFKETIKPREVKLSARAKGLAKAVAPTSFVPQTAGVS